MTLQPPLPSYEGDEAFAFVSYAHADAATVFPQVERLNQMGLNIWFDEGIQPGSSWRTELAQAITDCSLFIFFVTPRSVASEICTKEVNYAQSLGRRMLVIYLEATELPIGLDLALSDIQAIMKYQLSASEYDRKLAAALDAEAPVSAPSRTSKFPFGIVVSAVVAVIVVIALLWQIQSGDDPPGKVDIAAAPQQTVMMVLPFDNLSPSEEGEYFALGVYDDILVKVSKLPGLRVTGRISAMRFRGSDQSLSEIATEVGATHVLTGSVRRGTDDTVRIYAELMAVNEQIQLWSESYYEPVDEVFDIQDRLVAGVAAVIGIDVAEKESALETPNLEAYAKFVEARARLRTSSVENTIKGLELLKEAIELNPDFAEAHSQLAIAIFSNDVDPQLWQVAFDSAHRAHELDPDAAESQAAMALAKFDRDAIPYFDRALALNPNDSELRLAYGGLLIAFGRHGEANEQWREALQLNPLSAATHISMAIVLPSMGQRHESELHIQRALELEPNNTSVLRQIADYRLRQGRPVDAVRQYVRAHEINPNVPHSIVQIATIMINLRHYVAAEHWIERIPVSSSPLTESPSRHIQLLLRARLKVIDGDAADGYNAVQAMIAEFPDERGSFWLASATTRLALEAHHNERETESIQQRLRAVNLLEEVLSNSRRDGHYRLHPLNRDVVALLMMTLHTLGEDNRARSIAGDILSTPLKGNKWFGIGFYHGLAHAVLGNEADAVTAFHGLVEAPSSFLAATRFRGITQDDYGKFESLRNNVGFQQVVADLKAREASWVAELHGEFPQYF